MEISLILFLFLFIEIHSLVDKELPPPGNLASPLLPCFMLPHDFIQCDPPTFYDNASTTDPTIGLPKVCKDNESNKYGEHQYVSVLCRSLPGIECYGERKFWSRQTYPCVHYNGHNFVTTLLYSLFLGVFGVDRFVLGHTGTAVGKVLTLGGLGVWWVVDIVLLCTGNLTPADGSEWQVFY